MSAGVAYDRVLGALESHGYTTKPERSGARAMCPAHGVKGKTALKVTPIDGQVLLHCFGGCETEAVLDALGLSMADLFDSPRGKTYSYIDTTGTVVRQVHRTPDKSFPQSGDTSSTVLYRLPQVVEAVENGEPVYLVEGEKDADALATLGVVATTSPQGVDSWHKVDATPLHGAHVIVIPDNDGPGRKYARAIRETLADHAELTFLRPKTGKDAADHVAAGYDLEDFNTLDLDAAPDGIKTRFPRLDIAALLRADRPAREWVIDGLIPAGSSVALVAPAGTGKSLFLLAACIAVARGDKTFAGLGIRKRRVLLVDMENPDDDLAERFKDLGMTPEAVSDIDDLVFIHLPVDMAPLDTAIGGAELSAMLDAYDIRRGDIVVLDSLQRVVKGPENDSDTMRDYYRHTGLRLKRRGLTVVRTDNTGKDADRGARGTSGKRDDVDIELIFNLDIDKNQLRIKPGKTRLPGIQPMLVDRKVDGDGRLTFSTAGDPFRAAITDTIRMLAKLELPTETGERKAVEALKKANYKVSRTVVRAAVRERKDPLNTAPTTIGAPLPGIDEKDRADTERRTDGAPEQDAAESLEWQAEHRADTERRTARAVDADTPEPGAPPLPLSKERRTGASTLDWEELWEDDPHVTLVKNELGGVPIGEEPA